MDGRNLDLLSPERLTSNEKHAREPRLSDQMPFEQDQDGGPPETYQTEEQPTDEARGGAKRESFDDASDHSEGNQTRKRRRLREEAAIVHAPGATMLSDSSHLASYDLEFCASPPSEARDCMPFSSPLSPPTIEKFAGFSYDSSDTLNSIMPSTDYKAMTDLSSPALSSSHNDSRASQWTSHSFAEAEKQENLRLCSLDDQTDASAPSPARTPAPVHDDNRDASQGAILDDDLIKQLMLLLTPSPPDSELHKAGLSTADVVGAQP